MLWIMGRCSAKKKNSRTIARIATEKRKWFFFVVLRRLFLLLCCLNFIGHNNKRKTSNDLQVAFVLNWNGHYYWLTDFNWTDEWVLIWSTRNEESFVSRLVQDDRAASKVGMSSSASMVALLAFDFAWM